MTSDLPSIIFFGTPKIAVYNLKQLHDSNFKINAVVTKPDKPCGRNLKPKYPPVKIYALRNNIPVFQPESLNDDNFYEQIHGLHPDFFVVIAYGKLIPERILDIPKYTALNIHFSVLPKYRGAAPVARAILNGETETGISIINVAKQLDSGDIFYIIKDIINDNENTCDVEDKLIKQGINGLIQVLLNFEKYNEFRIVQDHDKATKAPMIKKDEGIINWGKSAEEIQREIRAFNPWPLSRSNLGDLILIFLKSELFKKEFQELKPGTVAEVIPKSGFVIKCGTGSLLIKEVQPCSKKPISAADFINGYRLKTGDKFC